MFEPFQLWDESVLLAIQNLHNPVLDFLMPIITHIGDAGIVWIALAALLLIPRKTRKFGIVLGAALALNVLCTNIILKPLIARPRPFDTIAADVVMLIPKPDDFSFPSGHTAASFAAAAALWFCSWKLALPATALASLIAFSRLYLYCHYPTDIIGGMIMGTLAALAVVLLYRVTFGRRWPLRRRRS